MHATTDTLILPDTHNPLQRLIEQRRAPNIQPHRLPLRKTILLRRRQLNLPILKQNKKTKNHSGPNDHEHHHIICFPLKNAHDGTHRRATYYPADENEHRNCGTPVMRERYRIKTALPNTRRAT
jgi:hypothetical protein